MSNFIVVFLEDNTAFVSSKASEFEQKHEAVFQEESGTVYKGNAAIAWFLQDKE